MGAMRKHFFATLRGSSAFDCLLVSASFGVRSKGRKPFLRGLCPSPARLKTGQFKT